MTTSSTIDTARTLLTDASHIEVFTGAGMSADSGIATYRDAQTGLWENVDPQDMASIDAWHNDPDTMFAWYLWRAHLAQQAEPNAGHVAVAKSPKTTVTTQNIDENFSQPIDLPKEPVAAITPPACPVCGGSVRPGVVWFGEALPQAEWKEAERRMRTADALVIVGTSGVVYPAAGLPLMAHAREIPIIEVTPMRTDLSHLANVVIEGTAANALPALLG
ncbi:NAD-dependent protein deacylase [Corynebacterium afermentans]|uniref:Sir2 family NAD-dependent protein deacetylase n=1 Tax=Corynebacterium afermentans TaxID=38286 RepID=UPI0025741551|nr:Sir2 family NAD-dependent protein deacetylase [Corynebacterium afermentans]MCG7292076.1 NAD-dependent protein deacylase [Corynebacterium afermentans]